MKKFRNIGNPIYSSIAVVVFIIVWEIFTRAKNIKEYILPAPSAILNEFITSGDLLLHHSMVTMTRNRAGLYTGVGACNPAFFAHEQLQAVSKHILPFYVFVPDHTHNCCSAVDYGLVWIRPCIKTDCLRPCGIFSHSSESHGRVELL